MRPVSKAFQEAIRRPETKDRIEGYLGLWASETVFQSWPFSENHVIQGSLVITDQLTGGKFGFGGVYTRNLSIKLDLQKFHQNMNKTLVNLTDGEIMLFYYLTLEDGTEERVYLGQYFIDSEKSSRKNNVLSIVAVDGLSKLDTPVSSETETSVYSAYISACTSTPGNRHTIANSKDFIEALPNGDITLTYDNSQIQTNRDLLMWLGMLTGTFVREYRKDPPDWDRSPLFGSDNGRPELVQIPKKYTASGISGAFDLETFKEDNGSIIPAGVRFSTDFTDTSIRVTKWQTNYNGETLTSGELGQWTLLPNTLEGTMELPGNPLLKSKSKSEIQSALNSIRHYGDDLRFCPFKTIFNGNPAIEVGDFVYLEPGGDVDETQYKHYGIVTYYKWKFRGKSELRCSTDAVAAYTRPKNNESSIALMSARTTDSGSNTCAKSQLEKRMDALEGRNSDSLVSSNGSKLVLTQNVYSPTFSGSDQLFVSVSDNGVVEARSITSFLNVFPGNTYLDQVSSYGKHIRTTIDADGIHYERQGGSWGANVNLLIEPLTNGFAISNNGQVLKVTDGNLYINGTQIT